VVGQFSPRHPVTLTPEAKQVGAERETERERDRDRERDEETDIETNTVRKTETD